MPRGDGTGPVGSGGRGYGRGRGMGCRRGQGRGQGRSMRRNLQVGVGNQMIQPPGVLVPTRDRGAIPVAQVDEQACKLCGACQTVCPTEAISLSDTEVKVNAEVCCGCGACVEICPNDAIKLN